MIIIKNAHIYRGKKDLPWASALAINGKKISMLSDDITEETLKYASEVIDLEGKYLIPDVSGALSFFDIDEESDMDEILEILRKKTLKSLIDDINKSPLEPGEMANFLVYEKNPVTAIGAVHFPEVDMIFQEGKLVYDVEEFNRNMLYTMCCTTQF